MQVSTKAFCVRDFCEVHVESDKSDTWTTGVYMEAQLQRAR